MHPQSSDNRARLRGTSTFDDGRAIAGAESLLFPVGEATSYVLMQTAESSWPSTDFSLSFWTFIISLDDHPREDDHRLGALVSFTQRDSSLYLAMETEEDKDEHETKLRLIVSADGDIIIDDDFDIISTAVNGWTHWSIVQDGRTCKVFQNGVTVVKTEAHHEKSLPELLGGDLRFGSQSTPMTAGFRGHLDDVQL